MAAAVLVCWVVGLVALARREHNVSDVDMLAMGALRVDPATYYYSLSRYGQPIGDVSSTIDTSARGFKSRNTVRLYPRTTRDSEQTVATSTAYLSRAFVLDSFSVTVTGLQHPGWLRAVPATNSKLLLPSLTPMALILSRPPRVGASSSRWLYNPATRRVENVTLTIAAESLFSVVDSAAFDSTAHTWIAAHADTVRSWKITVPTRGVSAWVDAQGRFVAASEPGGTTLLRTTYEIAMLNPKLLTP